jgi:hypothetical protein
VPEVDDDQLAALRRRRAAFGPIEVIKVTSNDPTGEATMAGTRRMTPQEQGEAHALLVKAVSDPDRQAARQALDELMRKLLVVHRLLEAEERLAKREPPAAGQRRNQVAVRVRSHRGGYCVATEGGIRVRREGPLAPRLAVRAGSRSDGEAFLGPPVWLCEVGGTGTASEPE